MQNHVNDLLSRVKEYSYYILCISSARIFAKEEKLQESFHTNYYDGHNLEQREVHTQYSSGQCSFSAKTLMKAITHADSKRFINK